MTESIIRAIKIIGNDINIVSKNLGFPIHDLLFSIKIEIIINGIKELNFMNIQFILIIKN